MLSRYLLLLFYALSLTRKPITLPYVLYIENSKISLSYTRPPPAEGTTDEPEKAKKKKKKKNKKAKIELEDYLACEDGTDPLVENPYDRYVHICASLPWPVSFMARVRSRPN